MVTERISARAWSPVLWLDVVSLGARVVVVIDPRAGEVRVEWGNLRHLDLTSFPIFTALTVIRRLHVQTKGDFAFRCSPVNG